MKHFQLSEFDSPDAPGSGRFMQPSFLAMLDQARERAGFPFVIQSGFRTLEHNKEVEGSEDSSHLRGCASDVRARSSRERFAIVKAAIEAGFRRIGIAKSFVHLDNDPTLPPNVIWLY